MSEIRRAVLNPENVKLAWCRSRNDPAPWGPGVEKWDLEKNAPFHLLKLVSEMERNGYRPEPIRQWAVKKGDGGRRVLSAQYLRDKFAQRLVLQALEAIAERMFHHDSFGYRPGRGVPHALKRVRERLHTGLRWLVDADIEKFFDSVPHRGVLRVVRKTFRDRWLTRVVRLWLDVGPHPSSILAPRRGLLQGAVLSPFLCNLYLHAFDMGMAKCNVTFVRYADDFLLFSADAESAHASRALAEKMLSRLGLQLNERKTRVCRAGPDVVFLGEPVYGPRNLSIHCRDGNKARQVRAQSLFCNKNRI